MQTRGRCNPPSVPCEVVIERYRAVKVCQGDAQLLADRLNRPGPNVSVAIVKGVENRQERRRFVPILLDEGQIGIADNDVFCTPTGSLLLSGHGLLRRFSEPITSTVHLILPVHRLSPNWRRTPTRTRSRLLEGLKFRPAPLPLLHCKDQAILMLPCGILARMIQTTYAYFAETVLSTTPLVRRGALGLLLAAGALMIALLIGITGPLIALVLALAVVGGYTHPHGHPLGLCGSGWRCLCPTLRQPPLPSWLQTDFSGCRAWRARLCLGAQTGGREAGVHPFTLGLRIATGDYRPASFRSRPSGCWSPCSC